MEEEFEDNIAQLKKSHEEERNIAIVKHKETVKTL